MKKICILSAVNIRHMTLISLYTDFLTKNNIEFDIIYMDKYGEKEEFPAKNIFAYKNVIKRNLPKIIKIIKYFKFKNYAISKLKENKYDFIIVWNDIAIFIFADYLTKHWKGKYCLNIRDYLYQKKIKWIYNRFRKTIKNSAFTTISSTGFKFFLPEHDYIQIHSLNMSVLKDLQPRTSFREKNKPIRIGFIGYVRFFETNKKLLDIFKNDNRFELHYYGTNANILKKYAEENNIYNTAFHDTFPTSETSKYLEKIDIINNLYGNGNIALDYALSIKLYHAIFTRIPILVCPNTFMEEIANEYQIGFTFHRYDDSIKEELYKWYSCLNYETFKLNCNKFLCKVFEDNEQFAKRIHEKFLIEKI